MVCFLLITQSKSSLKEPFPGTGSVHRKDVEGQTDTEVIGAFFSVETKVFVSFPQ